MGSPNILFDSAARASERATGEYFHSVGGKLRARVREKSLFVRSHRFLGVDSLSLDLSFYYLALTLFSSESSALFSVSHRLERHIVGTILLHCVR